MDLSEIIENKIQLIEQETGDTVIMEERSNIGVNADACVAFGCWPDMSLLPKILHKPSIDKVHILHEIIHLEKFFVEGYQIVAHYNTPDLQHNQIVAGVEKKFKDVPEDYVAHKTIWEYGFNPIKESWFEQEVPTTDLELAVWLVNAKTFSEFLPSYEKWSDDLWEDVRKMRPQVYSMAQDALRVLEAVHYRNKESYNASLSRIIRIFAPQYYPAIHPSLLTKINGIWVYNP